MPSESAVAQLPVSSNSVVNIDGCEPVRHFRPQNTSQMAELLADAEAAGESVTPIGGATQLAYGNVLERCGWAAFTSDLNQVFEYQPTDMTISVGAGISLHELNAILGQHGQEIPVDTDDAAAATIGGLVATALTGPRRYGRGTLRDLLIGIGVAHPTGNSSKAGGMVVKNVSGYDLMRLYLGSLGTLAVITSVNLKVLPRAIADSTGISQFTDWQAALDVAMRIHNSTMRPAALELWRADATWRVAYRLQGRQSAISSGKSIAASLVGRNSVALEQDESARFWIDYQAPQALASQGNSVLIRLATSVSGVSGLMSSIEQIENAGDARMQIWCSPGIGQVRVRIVADAGFETQQHQLSQLRALTVSSVVLAAPRSIKEQIDVFGDDYENIELMRTLKLEFDPQRVLNPGRFIGRI